MKQPKRPNREQKAIISNHKLIANNWMVEEETEDELVVIYKFGKTVKHLKKDVDLWRKGKK